jgi:hypothetical protein
LSLPQHFVIARMLNDMRETAIERDRTRSRRGASREGGSV